MQQLVHTEHARRSTGTTASADAHVQLHAHVISHALVRKLQLHAPGGTAFNIKDQQQASTPLPHMSGADALLIVGVQFARPPAAELARVLEGADEAAAPAYAAAADWAAPLADLVANDGRAHAHLKACQPQLIARRPWELDVAVCPQVCCVEGGMWHKRHTLLLRAHHQLLDCCTSWTVPSQL